MMSWYRQRQEDLYLIIINNLRKGTECISVQGYGPGRHYGSTLTKQWKRTVNLLESGFGFTVFRV